MRSLLLSCVMTAIWPGMLWAQSGSLPVVSQQGSIQLVSNMVPCSQPCPHCGAFGCSRSVPGGPTCAATPDCGAHPGCSCNVCTQKQPCRPCAPPPQAPQPVLQAAPPGIFVQPPASGTVYGAQNRTEIEGMALTFPEVSLRMPTLRFPSVQRSRRNARMELDRATAPYMEQAAPAMTAAPPAQAMMTPAAAPMMMMAPSSPGMAMAAPSAAPMAMMAAPSSAPTMMMATPSFAPAMTMMQFAPQYVPVAPQAPTPQQAPPTPQQSPRQETPPASPTPYYPPQYGPPRSPECDAPQPGCGPYGYSAPTTDATLADLNARMRQLEETERRIDQKLSQLHATLAARQAASTEPHHFHAETRMVPAEPITQPTNPPAQNQASGFIASSHVAQRASFQAETHAYQSSPVVNEPAPPIRQPFSTAQQPSQARITGFSQRP